VPLWCVLYLLTGYAMYHALWACSDCRFCCKEYLGGLTFALALWPLGLLLVVAAVVEEMLDK
jgi:hypothetical protein